MKLIFVCRPLRACLTVTSLLFPFPLLSSLPPLPSYSPSLFSFPHSTKSKKPEKPSFSLSSLGKLLNMNKEEDDEAELLPTSSSSASSSRGGAHAASSARGLPSTDSSSSLSPALGGAGKKLSSYLGRGKKSGPPKNLFDDL